MAFAIIRKKLVGFKTHVGITSLYSMVCVISLEVKLDLNHFQITSLTTSKVNFV